MMKLLRNIYSMLTHCFHDAMMSHMLNIVTYVIIELDDDVYFNPHMHINIFETI